MQNKKGIFRLGFFLMVFLMSILVIPGIHAEWEVADSCNVSILTGTKLLDLFTNSTSGAESTHFLTAYNKGYIYEIDASCTSVANHTLPTGSSNYHYGIAANFTNGAVAAGRLYYTVDFVKKLLFTYNSSLNNISSCTVPVSALQNPIGLATPSGASAGKIFWTIDGASGKVISFDTSCTKQSEFSIGSYCEDDCFNIFTNGTTTTPSDFWLSDDFDDVIYHVSGSGDLLETIDVGALGIADPHGIDTPDKGGAVDEIYILAQNDQVLYKIATTQTAPTFVAMAQNQTKTAEKGAAIFHANFSDDVLLHSCILSTNETGSWINYSSGTYGSPAYAGTGPSVTYEANFTWINNLFSVSGLPIYFNWSVHCNDSLGLWTASTQLTQNATPTTAICNGTDVNITSINTSVANNVTITFVGTGTPECLVLLPKFYRNASLSECNYKCDICSKIRTYNYSASSCGVNFTCSVNDTRNRIRIDEDISIKVHLPSNIPAGIAAGVIFSFLVIYTVSITRRWN